MWQALLLLYCFDASVKGAVYKAFSVCRDQVVPGSLSSWVRWCGVLQPCQASRVRGCDTAPCLNTAPPPCRSSELC